MATPAVTVVVPSHGRPEAVEACLAALAALEEPRGGYEIVVVDDGSPLPLEPRVGHWGDRLPLRILRQARAGPAAARNAGVAAARGEIVAFTGDDCRPRQDWLTSLVRHFEIDPERAIGGRIENGLPDNLYSTATNLLIRHLYDYFNGRPEEARFFTPNNLAFPAESLRRAGGFRESFLTGEDRELCHRWRRSGHRLAYAGDVVVDHLHPLTFRGFCTLHYGYGRGSRRYRAEVGGELEPLSFYLDLVRSPLSQRRDGRGLALSALLGVAQAANAMGYLRQSLRS